MTTKDELENALRVALRKWPLYREADHVMATPLDDTGDHWSLQYCTYFEGGAFTATARTGETQPNMVSLDVLPCITYLLSIRIGREHRGQGLGAALYDRLCDFARSHGCLLIEQTPSGQTPSGQSREAYLLKRGWKRHGRSVYKAMHPDFRKEVTQGARLARIDLNHVSGCGDSQEGPIAVFMGTRYMGRNYYDGYRDFEAMSSAIKFRDGWLHAGYPLTVDEGS